MRVLSLFLTLARSRGFSAGVLFLTEDPQALDKPKRNLQKGIVEFLTESALFREFLRLMTCLYGRNLENTKALRKSAHNSATEALGSTSSLLSEAPSPWALSGVQSSPPQFSFSVLSACGGWKSQTTPEPHVLLECGRDLFLDSRDCGGGLPAEVMTSPVSGADQGGASPGWTCPHQVRPSKGSAAGAEGSQTRASAV